MREGHLVMFHKIKKQKLTNTSPLPGAMFNIFN